MSRRFALPLTLTIATGLGLAALAGCNMPAAPDDFQPGQNSPADGSGGPSAGDDHREAGQHVGDLVVTVPDGWKVEEPEGQFRIAQYSLPRVSPDKEHAALVVTSFPGGVGSVEDNLNRWYAQMTQPDGRPSQKAAKVTRRTVDGMNLTRLDLSGTYTASGGPMMAAGAPKPGWRMLAAHLAAPDAAYVFKLTGPAKTVARWAKSFDDYLNSIRKHE